RRQAAALQGASRISMNRRYFTMLLANAWLVAKTLRAEHRVISMDPLEMEFELWSLQGQYTSVEDFYVRNHFQSPSSPEAATLKIEGEVEVPQQLTKADLATLKERKLGAVLECAGNRVGSSGLVSNGAWTGWAFKDILMLARPNAAAGHLHLHGRDGYKRSVPLDRAMADAVLVTQLNSRPLTLPHGAPWRALLQGWYGMDSVKWLERIVVAAAPLPSEGGIYQQSRQTSSGEIEREPLPRVRVKSAILNPRPGSVLRKGKTELRGVAWTGAGTIASVEVSADAGRAWQSASLISAGALEWVIWKTSVELTEAGIVEFVSRAKDTTGQAQPVERDTSRLDGYANNWYHRVRCTVV
ncbi:MAG: molybdopterin-dependent oxidoreductase, partial [Terriglobia bacterium]